MRRRAARIEALPPFRQPEPHSSLFITAGSRASTRSPQRIRARALEGNFSSYGGDVYSEDHLKESKFTTVFLWSYILLFLVFLLKGWRSVERGIEDASEWRCFGGESFG